jgi:hypothetical protein
VIDVNSNSGKCIGCLDTILSCQSTINSYYISVICPVWSYGIQLWGCPSDFNIEIIQRYQNKALKCIVNTPWYIRNSDHYDLKTEMVTDIIAKFAKSHGKRLQNHINTQASRLLNAKNITRRFKQKTSFELVRC